MFRPKITYESGASMILLGMLGLALLEIATSGCKQSKEARRALKRPEATQKIDENRKRT